MSGEVSVGLEQILGGRSTQEDAAAIWSGTGIRHTHKVDLTLADPMLSHPGGLHVVLADGMGGHAAGDIASNLICDVFLSTLQRALTGDNETAPAQSGGAQSGGTQSGGTQNSRGPSDRLADALEEANDAIQIAISEQHGLDGMGATLVGLEVRHDPKGDGPLLDWVSVGDSPLYLIRNGELALLNEDHSLAPALDQMVVDGQMTEEDARNDPRRHMLRSAVTGDQIDLVDLSRKPLVLVSGDIVVAASDGVQTLEDDEIARISTGYAVDGAEAIASALVRSVTNARDPYQDNTTIVVLQVA